MDPNTDDVASLIFSRLTVFLSFLIRRPFQCGSNTLRPVQWMLGRVDEPM